MITHQIQKTFPKLRKSEQQAAQYILEHTEQIEQISLEQLAKNANVSQPTILRMFKAVGYNGFKEAKVAFIEERMQKGEVAIGISYTGTSQNTVDVLKQAKKSGATTIAITNFTDTPLLKYADIVILTSNHQLLYGNDIFSRTIHLAVVDVLCMGLVVNDYDKYQERLKESGRMIQSRKYK